MNTLFDYLEWRGDLTFSQDPVHEVDGMILARLSYLPFDGLLSGDFSKMVPLKEVARSLLSDRAFSKRVLLDRDDELLAALSQSPRFENLLLAGYVNLVDPESQTQFAALTIKLSRDLFYVVFRGTDNTLVGWKEDFNMTFTFPIPAQTSAKEYLEGAFAAFPHGEFLVGGHSKGGNLAVYAAAFADPALRPRIRTVINYDGPGFPPEVLETPQYREMAPKVKTYLPQSSVVGMLLEHEEGYSVIHSYQLGIFQHDLYSWQVAQNRFVPIEKVTGSSRFVDRTLKEFVAKMTGEERADFVDTIYEILSETDANTLRELKANGIENAKILLSGIKNLDDPTKSMITDTLKSLVESAKKSAKKGLVQTFQREEDSKEE